MVQASDRERKVLAAVVREVADAVEENKITSVELSLEFDESRMHKRVRIDVDMLSPILADLPRYE